MRDDNDTLHIDFPTDHKYLHITLPDGIGYVEITTGQVHGPTGYPVIGVDAVSETKDIPAADGRNYTPARDRDSGVVLVGRPGVKMLEEERFMQRAATIIKAHDRGDHTGCPGTCPVISTDVPRETPRSNYNIRVNVKDDDGERATIPIDRERLNNLWLAMDGVNDTRSVMYQGKTYTVQGAEVVCALADDVPRETKGD